MILTQSGKIDNPSINEILRVESSQVDRNMLRESQKLRGSSAKHTKSDGKWVDQLKDVTDPESLNNLYIKNLKVEIRLLES